METTERRYQDPPVVMPDPNDCAPGIMGLSVPRADAQVPREPELFERTSASLTRAFGLRIDQIEALRQHVTQLNAAFTTYYARIQQNVDDECTDATRSSHPLRQLKTHALVIAEMVFANELAAMSAIKRFFVKCLRKVPRLHSIQSSVEKLLIEVVWAQNITEMKVLASKPKRDHVK